MANNYPSYRRAFLQNFTSGIGWALGTTFGFALVVTLGVATLNFLGGLPLVGQFFADIIKSTEKALIR